MTLTLKQKERYSRFLRLNEIQKEDMESIVRTTVGVVGAGGLGSSSLRLLTAIGFGRIIIVDSDEVELSNIQRQTLYNTEDVGRPKVEAAVENLMKLNPEVKFEPKKVRVNEDNVEDILRDTDIIIDGLDSFKTRKIVNKFSLESKKPYIFAGAVEFYANTTTFQPDSTGCFHCIMGDAKDNPEMTCASIGITPEILPMVTSVQVREAVLIATDRKPNLANRLLSIDIGTLVFEMFDIKKNEECEVCGV
ncbi:MAG: hypothetical protein BAJATHORv1_10185 [Candidatus Thorarchaeota archaeon]|nr:MAG: hypothetical protein BAJATHORv1_10185 [Candidatus Thorarchaeota archaeon]